MLGFCYCLFVFTKVANKDLKYQKCWPCLTEIWTCRQQIFFNLKRLEKLADKNLMKGELGLFNQKKRRLRGDLTRYINTWRKGAERREPGFLVAPSEVNGHKSMQRSFCLNIGKHVFHCECVTEHWTKLPKRVVSSSLETVNIYVTYCIERERAAAISYLLRLQNLDLKVIIIYHASFLYTFKHFAKPLQRCF